MERADELDGQHADIPEVGAMDTNVSELRKIQERELLLRRLRGEASCVECRRCVLSLCACECS